MNFFEHQDQARRRTGCLLALYCLAVGGIIVAVYVVVVLAFGHDEALAMRWWRPDLLLWVSAAAVAVIGVATWQKIRLLGHSGVAVAASVGGRSIDPATSDEGERRLVNVVEEMAIASGVAVPATAVLEEDSINAFAAGYDVDDAVVAVTRGCLESLSRDELQGVVAHEFSHVLNGDMRMNTRLIGVLYGIMAIGVLGRWLLRGSHFRTSRRSALGPIAVGLGLWIIGSIGTLFGRLIQAAISRQREFLADASAVQFTRNPRGIAGALQKIAAIASGSFIQARGADELSHFFFANAMHGSFLANAFATHPPLPERISRIDPSASLSAGDPAAPPAGSAGTAAAFSGNAPLPEAVAAGLAGRSSPAGAPSRDPRDKLSADPKQVVESVGAPTRAHLDHGRKLVVAIPEDLREGAHVSTDAVALVCGLLLDRDREIRDRQLEILRRSSLIGAYRRLNDLWPELVRLERPARLPLLEICVPALRQLAQAHIRQLLEDVKELARADERLTLFEFALVQILTRRLSRASGADPKRRAQLHSFRPLLDETSVLLSALAYAGATDHDAAAAAHKAAAQRLPRQIREATRHLPPGSCNVEALSGALDGLGSLAGTLRGVLLDACGHCVLADGVVKPAEAELLRAVAHALDCPLPPFLPRV